MVDMQTELEQATSMAILAATFADGEDNDERSRIIAAAKYICAGPRARWPRKPSSCTAASA